MHFPLTPHGQPGTLLAICGFDGTGKSTLEEAVLAAVSPTSPCSVAWAPTEWWRQDANIRRTLFGSGPGQVVPEESLLHFSLADCHALQADVILPALARGELVIVNRYLFDMVALLEARGLTRPEWLPGAAARIVAPDHCFVLDGAAEMIVDRVVRRDGAMPGRFDQDVRFTERYNTALRRMAEANHLTVLRADAAPGENLRRCLDVLRDAEGRPFPAPAADPVAVAHPG
ncbi:hypothetical protein [Streptomyces sp. NBC_01794]|uniref:hypothetical protein n=1 Tax=Streptomyces sp. NBC_01794 TaxID=2975942 RepID=UPI00308529EB|nr:hypothetical protein OIE54_20220 [Streptomyces sp. NBC_01794]